MQNLAAAVTALKSVSDNYEAFTKLVKNIPRKNIPKDR